MRINTNIAALNANRNLEITQSALSKSMEKLSSGFRINHASDDAAGLAISNKLSNEARSLTQASANIDQANAMLQIAEGGASTVQNILERMKELATQASSANNSTQLTTLNDEYSKLKDEITRLSESTMYQGTALLDGSFSGTFQVGATNDSYNQIGVALSSDLGGLTLGDLSSAANAQTAMDNVETALDTVNTALGTIGAYQNRLDYAQANVKTSIQNISAANSVIRDVDMATEMATFSKNQILAQAGTAMLAQANQLPSGVLQLLR